MSILHAYLTLAPAIVFLHGVFLAACVWIWVKDSLLLQRERKAYRELESQGFDHPVKRAGITRISGEIEPSDSSSVQAAAEVVRLNSVLLSMAEKGEMLGPDALRSRLSQSVARHDFIFRVLLNAFVISGLLGTLLNLWHLGPAFFQQMVQGQSGNSQAQIGMAFSASIFGLGVALFSTLIGLFIRYRREKFVRSAANSIFDNAARKMPSKDHAAVAKVLKDLDKTIEDFYSKTKGFLTNFKTKQEEFAGLFIKQIESSSDKLSNNLSNIVSKTESSTELLSRNLNEIAAQWKTIADTATGNIADLGTRLGSQISNLSEATAKTQETLSVSLDRIEQAENIRQDLSKAYTHAGALLKELKDEFIRFGAQWQQDLASLSQSHAERLEQTSVKVADQVAESSIGLAAKIADASSIAANTIEQSATSMSEELKRVAQQGWERYETESNKWHEQNVEALNRFADNIATSMSRWSDERKLLEEQIKLIVDTWKNEIDKTIKAMQESLKGLSKQVKELITDTQGALRSETTSVQLGLKDLTGGITSFVEKADSLVALCTAVSQQVKDLERNVKEFGANVDSSFGKSIDGMTRAVKAAVGELESSLANDLSFSQSINAMTKAVKDFETSLKNNSNSPPVTVLPGLAPTHIDASLGLTADKIKAAVDEIKSLAGDMASSLDRIERKASNTTGNAFYPASQQRDQGSGIVQTSDPITPYRVQPPRKPNNTDSSKPDKPVSWLRKPFDWLIRFIRK